MLGVSAVKVGIKTDSGASFSSIRSLALDMDTKMTSYFAGATTPHQIEMKREEAKTILTKVLKNFSNDDVVTDSSKKELSSTLVYKESLRCLQLGVPQSTVAKLVERFHAADEGGMCYNKRLWEDKYPLARRMAINNAMAAFQQAVEDFIEGQIASTFWTGMKGKNATRTFKKVMDGIFPINPEQILLGAKLDNDDMADKFDLSEHRSLEVTPSQMQKLMFLFVSVLSFVSGTPESDSRFFLPRIFRLNIWKRLSAMLEGHPFSWDVSIRNPGRAGNMYMMIEFLMKEFEDYDEKTAGNKNFPYKRKMNLIIEKIKEMIAKPDERNNRLLDIYCKEYAEFAMFCSCQDRDDFTDSELATLRDKYGIDPTHFFGWKYLDTLFYQFLTRPQIDDFEVSYAFPGPVCLIKQLVMFTVDEVATAFNYFLDTALLFFLLRAYEKYQESDQVRKVYIVSDISSVHGMQVPAGRAVVDYYTMINSGKLPWFVETLADQDVLMRFAEVYPDDDDDEDREERNPNKYRGFVIDGSISSGKTTYWNRIKEITDRLGQPMRFQHECHATIKAYMENRTLQQQNCSQSISYGMMYADVVERGPLSSAGFNAIAGNPFKGRPQTGPGHLVYSVVRSVEARIVGHAKSRKFVMWDSLKTENDFKIDQMMSYFITCFAKCSVMGYITCTGSVVLPDCEGLLDVFAKVPGFCTRSADTENSKKKVSLIFLRWFNSLHECTGKDSGRISTWHFLTDLFWTNFLKTGFLPMIIPCSNLPHPYKYRLFFFNAEGIAWPEPPHVNYIKNSDSRERDLIASLNSSLPQRPATCREQGNNLCREVFQPNFWFPIYTTLSDMVENETLQLPYPINTKHYAKLRVLDLPLHINIPSSMEAAAFMAAMNQEKIKALYRPEECGLRYIQHGVPLQSLFKTDSRYSHGEPSAKKARYEVHYGLEDLGINLGGNLRSILGRPDDMAAYRGRRPTTVVTRVPVTAADAVPVLVTDEGIPESDEYDSGDEQNIDYTTDMTEVESSV